MIKTLQLTNFRSYPKQTISLGDQTTLIVGPNASGKTNLLEAIYLLATTKSFRAKDHELINYQADHFRLEAELVDKKVAVGFQQEPIKTKKISHDDGLVPPIKHIGTLPVVLFEPNDLLLVFGSPDRRRRYIDGILSQTEPTYLKSLHNYRRVLQHRNKLLSDKASTQDLFAWDMKLSKLAAELISSRLKLFSYLNSKLNSKYQQIAGGSVEISLQYKSSFSESNQAGIYQALTTNHPRDLAAGFTTVGPHRDDFSVIFSGEDIENIASRGEIRSFILALKAIELELVEEVYNQKPVLLLDDVFSELDEARRQFLVGMVKGYQTIITTTNADSVTDSIGPGHLTIYTKDLQNG